MAHSLAHAAMQPAQVRAVQNLFARATDVALLPNGLTGLESMIVPQEQPPAPAPANNPGAITPATPPPPPSGTNGGDAGTTQTQRTTSQASRTARALSPTGVKPSNGYDSKPLNQLVGQIRQQWRQKYKQDFRIGNDAKVYADITAADLRGQAQTAGSHVAGNPTTKPASQPPAAAQAAAPMDVTVPAVGDSKPVQIQVIPGPGETLQFSSATPVDRRQLAQNLQKHLQMLEQQQSQWPADVNDAYRMVSQHVLMAIVETTGGPEQTAIPAAGRQRASGASHVQGIGGESAPSAAPGSAK